MRLNLTANMFVTPEGKLNYNISFHITVPKMGSESKSLVVYSRQVSKLQDAETKKFNHFTSILHFLHQFFKIIFARTFF